MAYIDFTSFAPPPGGQARTTHVVGTLGRLEWEVVRLARRDGLGSLKAPGWLTRLYGAMFGRDVNRQLADPRLEALRRFAVRAWRQGYALPVSAIKELKSAGFSIEQLETVLAKVAIARTDVGLRAAA